MNQSLNKHLSSELSKLHSEGLYKAERILTSTQSGEIELSTGEKVLNFCANNYLGLADNAELINAAKIALERYGYGMASVRFICGTQEEHKQLEKRISSFLKMEDTILYPSCFDANTGLFETLLDAQDAIISDSLNHASIIDGVRLCKASRYRYENNNMKALEAELEKAHGARFKIIATDGVFSMDGNIANLQEICNLAEKHNAMVMVDDSHAVGLLGGNGRGSVEYCGVEGRVDIITGTLGKALGGASGGYTAASNEIVDWLRQRSRPYLFSNTLAPVVAATSLTVFDLIENGAELRKKLFDNTDKFRAKMSKLGFNLGGKDHPIIPVMLGDASLAQQMSNMMLKHGIYVTGFSYPVVPVGKARIRTQMSAAHGPDDIDRAIAAFEKCGKELDVI